MSHRTECKPPPTIVNGRQIGSSRPVPDTVFKYACNEGFFPFGPNSENLETKCMEDLSYTLGADELATCVPIGN